MTEQSAQAQDQERLPGSSEVLVLVLRKFKFLEGEQAKGGFTSSILAYGALLGRTTADTVQQALACVQTKHVKTWCQQHLGQTLQSKSMLCEVSFAGCSCNKTRKNNHDLEAHIFNSPE